MKLRVLLARCRDHDTGEGNAERRWFKVDGWAAASDAVRAYIEVAGIGSRQWAGGEVRCGTAVVGKISYNGRVWECSV